MLRYYSHLSQQFIHVQWIKEYYSHTFDKSFKCINKITFISITEKKKKKEETSVTSAATLQSIAYSHVTFHLRQN